VINEHDITALTNLLQRTPMSPGETIYARDLLARLSRLAQPESEPGQAPERGALTAEPAPAEDVSTEAAPRSVPLRPPPLAGY
jgi:hypothetical protein